MGNSRIAILHVWLRSGVASHVLLSPLKIAAAKSGDDGRPFFVPILSRNRWSATDRFLAVALDCLDTKVADQITCLMLIRSRTISALRYSCCTPDRHRNDPYSCESVPSFFFFVVSTQCRDCETTAATTTTPFPLVCPSMSVARACHLRSASDRLRAAVGGKICKLSRFYFVPEEYGAVVEMINFRNTPASCVQQRFLAKIHL